MIVVGRGARKKPMLAKIIYFNMKHKKASVGNWLFVFCPYGNWSDYELII
jgi:hypothetical protein